MPISYTAHARSRMAERAITEADVEAVLAEHVLSIDSRGSIEYQGIVNGRKIVVVTVRPGVQASRVRIKTVWID